MPDRLVFQRYLREQLSFIDRSCAAFDAGFRAEGIRIATSIRVLLHQGSSSALLRYLGAHKIELRTTVPDSSSSDLLLSMGMVVHRYEARFGGGGHQLMPLLDGSSRPVRYSDPSGCPQTVDIGRSRLGRTMESVMGDSPAFVPAPRWWNQIVAVVNGVRPTRRDIVLGAANKEGGAHVDPNLTPTYERLRAAGAYGFYPVQKDGEYVHYPIEDAHLVCLRQMGYELLNSPALLGLTA